MKIIVDRYMSTNEATLSRISVVGDNLFISYRCYGLEDEYREEKVKGETRIPAGVYNVGVRTEGGFHARYSKDRRFRDIHQGMLHILGVTRFEFILIHVGNFETDTDGCLLVGQERNEENMTLSNSAVAYRILYLHCIEAAKNGELTIEFQDNDREPDDD